MKRLVTALVFVVATSVSAFAQSLPVPSYWLNQRGSEMKLYTITPQGNFTGIYLNHAAGFKCQNTPFNPPHTITGHASGTSVIFTVVWNNGVVNCNSKTVWRGQLLNGRTLATKWILTGPGINPPITGTDIFQLQP